MLLDGVVHPFRVLCGGRVALDKSEGVVKHRDFLWRCASIAFSSEQVEDQDSGNSC